MKICYIIDANTILSERIAAYFSGKGHETQIIYSVSKYPYPVGEVKHKELGLPKRRLKIPYGEHLDNVMKVKDEVASFDPDIVHGHYLSTVASQVLALKKKYPVVLSAWGSDILVDARAKHHRILIKRASARAGKLTSVAEHITARMVEIGVPGEKIETFPFGVDMDFYRPGLDADELRNTHGISDSDRVVVSTRRLEPIYNHELVLKAFSVVIKNRPEVKLVLVSSGSLEKKLKGQVARYKIEDNVIFTGFVKDELLPRYLNLADIYLSASFSDGASLSLFEAMACGVYPVVSDIPANRYWVKDGKNGHLFPTDDHASLAGIIETVLDNRGRQKKAIDGNLALVREKAEWKGSMERLEKIYRSLVKK